MPLSVFVVDDDESNRETLRVALEDMGYAVIEAGDGMLARDQLRTRPSPLVVLLDMMLKGLDGAALLREAQPDRRLARHAYILMTASPGKITPEFRELLVALDVPIIEKPFDLGALLDTVEMASQRLGSPSA